MTAYDVVKAHYDANDRGDLAGMLAPLADDVRWTEMAGFPCAGTYIGPDAVRENVFERLGREWDGYTASITELLDAGDTVIGLGTYSGTYKATGESMNVRVAHVWRVAGDKVVAFEQFTDTLLVARATSEF
ncbi:nuclear transport factor 2 family protein [Humibacter ginsenosidimutans]|uniref:Nuclear transport factor 2 family protein n=1 Tax=Humibacter ginsenosidimutans TaxID=2599293 RepID=A0A5B8M3V0_9MICO|nr:nuclear transport factor 2 family protein [Humibacter ginsenosidimutans]QDZ14639.1 nuclear transport factor 2 family protein [Humibacter ginsenosidimutans]